MRSILAVGAKVGIARADPHISDPGAAAGTGLAGLLKDVAAMHGLSLSAKQIPLGTAQGDPFVQNLDDRIVQPREFFQCK